MLDPVSIATIVSAILAFTGPVLRTLWTKIKSFYGRVCKTSSYLQQLDRNQFTRDLQTMLSSSASLTAAVQSHYLSAQRPAQITYQVEAGYSSDFSDFEF